MLIAADMNTSRRYAMVNRAASAANTRSRILRALVDLSTEKLTIDIVLTDIATRAGVSVQTILRHFGSRDGLFDAAVEFAAAAIVEERSTPTGDVPAAVKAIVRHYEARGDWVIAMLGQELGDARIRRITERGRQTHRAWVEAVFAPQLVLTGDITSMQTFWWSRRMSTPGSSCAATADTIATTRSGRCCDSSRRFCPATAHVTKEVTEMANLFFVTWDGGGNVAPALEIAGALVRRGDRVRFLGQPSQRETILGAGFEFESYRNPGAWTATRGWWWSAERQGVPRSAHQSRLRRGRARERRPYSDRHRRHRLPALRTA